MTAGSPGVLAGAPAPPGSSGAFTGASRPAGAGLRAAETSPPTGPGTAISSVRPSISGGTVGRHPRCRAVGFPDDGDAGRGRLAIRPPHRRGERRDIAPGRPARRAVTPDPHYFDTVRAFRADRRGDRAASVSVAWVRAVVRDAGPANQAQRATERDVADDQRGDDDGGGNHVGGGEPRARQHLPDTRPTRHRGPAIESPQNDPQRQPREQQRERGPASHARPHATPSPFRTRARALFPPPRPPSFRRFEREVHGEGREGAAPPAPRGAGGAITNREMSAAASSAHRVAGLLPPRHAPAPVAACDGAGPACDPACSGFAHGVIKTRIRRSRRAQRSIKLQSIGREGLSSGYPKGRSGPIHLGM